MANLSYNRGPCKTMYSTVNGPTQCRNGALRGKDYCSKHRPKPDKSKEIAEYMAGVFHVLGDNELSKEYSTYAKRLPNPNG